MYSYMAILSGVDIVYIPKIEKILNNDNNLLKKFFHGSELTNRKPEHLAGIIAAKEAFFKALGMVPRFQDVELAYEGSGKPKLIVASEFQYFKSCDISISHDQDYAIALVILER